MTYTQVWDHMQGQVSESSIQRDEDGAFIPFDDANTDYQEYKAWLEEGNKPNSVDPPPVPDPVTPLEDRVDDLEARVEDLEGNR